MVLSSISSLANCISLSFDLVHLQTTLADFNNRYTLVNLQFDCSLLYVPNDIDLFTVLATSETTSAMTIFAGQSDTIDFISNLIPLFSPSTYRSTFSLIQQHLCCSLQSTSSLLLTSINNTLLLRSLSNDFNHNKHHQHLQHLIDLKSTIHHSLSIPSLPIISFILQV